MTFLTHHTWNTLILKEYILTLRKNTYAFVINGPTSNYTPYQLELFKKQTELKTEQMELKTKESGSSAPVRSPSI